jgi:GntR family transcriptional regulator
MKDKSFIDAHSAVPIFQQIVDEIERNILTGELKEGDFLTSVREFAVKNTVNPNTVAKAYQMLQTLELVEPVRGLGLKVKKISEKQAAQRRRELLNEKFDELIRLATSLGITKDEIVQIISERK